LKAALKITKHPLVMIFVAAMFPVAFRAFPLAAVMPLVFAVHCSS